jgi:hypothetical protein
VLTTSLPSAYTPPSNWLTTSVWPVSDAQQTPKLESHYIAHAAAKLEARIRARLPGRRLAAVAGRLAEMVPEVQQGFDSSYARFKLTRRWSRVASVLIVLGTLLALVLALRDAFRGGELESFDWVPLVESAINDVVFAAIAVFFLWALPERRERRTLVGLLHRLRSLAHVVDMHQLDKDPEQARSDYVPTEQSPPNRMNAEELHHYFDYCSELVSLIAKTAALCAEHSSDAVVLDTVSNLETLAAQMSQKIWQKISLLPEH